MRKCNAFTFAVTVMCAIAALVLYSTPTQAQEATGDAAQQAGSSPSGRLVNRNPDGTVNVDVESWRRRTESNHPSHKGCFTKSYPADEWTEIQCGQVDPQKVSFQPSEVGYDHETTVSGTTIAQAQGEITPIANLVSEYNQSTTGVAQPYVQNMYSLQINTNFSSTGTGFSTPACNGHSGCTGWQQFIYSTTVAQGILMQYELLNYGAGCPSPWSQAGNNCIRFSPTVTVPPQPITNLGNLQFVGNAYCPNASDSVTLYVNNGNPSYYDLEADQSILWLCQAWTEVGFNVLGDANYTEAVFNPTAELGISDYIFTANYPTLTVPSCATPNTGISGESNNMIVSTTCTVYPNNDPPDTYYTETAPYLIPNGTYYIQSTNSSLDLSDPNSSKTNGQDMEQLYQTLAPNQLWTVTNIGGTNNIIYLINQASGLALDVSGDSKNGGALIDQWPYGGSGATNQQWNVLPIVGCTSSCFELTSVHSGLALETVGGSTTNGAKIDQNPYAGKTWQQWFFFAH